MSEINSQALREAAEKAGEDKWQAKKINGDFFVIRHGSYTRQHGYRKFWITCHSKNLFTEMCCRSRFR